MPTAHFLARQTDIGALRKTPLGQKTGHSDRAALENLFNALNPGLVHVHISGDRHD